MSSPKATFKSKKHFSTFNLLFEVLYVIRHLFSCFCIIVPLYICGQVLQLKDFIQFIILKAILMPTHLPSMPYKSALYLVQEAQILIWSIVEAVVVTAIFAYQLRVWLNHKAYFDAWVYPG